MARPNGCWRKARRSSTASCAPKSHRLEGGEQVELTVPEPAPVGLEREDVPLRIAWEDEHVLVVDKPAGVVVHPSPGHASGTLVHGLVGLAAGGEDEERPGIVHRLDRDTSGLLVVARSEEAYGEAAGARPRPGARTALQGARARTAALLDRPDRGSDRP